MTRVTIIRDEGRINVDGKTAGVDLSSISAQVHVIQWYGDHGEIEYVYDPASKQKEMNETITDFAIYQPLVDLASKKIADDEAAAAAVVPPG